jgi:hypothetical protein
MKEIESFTERASTSVVALKVKLSARIDKTIRICLRYLE